jgi:hypothetical protein
MHIVQHIISHVTFHMRANVKARAVSRLRSLYVYVRAIYMQSTKAAVPDRLTKPVVGRMVHAKMYNVLPLPQRYYLIYNIRSTDSP